VAGVFRGVDISRPAAPRVRNVHQGAVGNHHGEDTRALRRRIAPRGTLVFIRVRDHAVWEEFAKKNPVAQDYGQTWSLLYANRLISTMNCRWSGSLGTGGRQTFHNPGAAKKAAPADEPFTNNGPPARLPILSDEIGEETAWIRLELERAKGLIFGCEISSVGLRASHLRSQRGDSGHSCSIG